MVTLDEKLLALYLDEAGNLCFEGDLLEEILVCTRKKSHYSKCASTPQDISDS